MSDENAALRFERSCAALGAAIAEALPTPVYAPGGPIPPGIEAAWRQRRAPHGRRAAGRALGVLAVLSVAAAAWLILGRGARVLHYQLDGVVAQRDGRIATPPAGGATLRFSEGTTVAMAPGAAVRVRSCTRTGATIELERGRASLSVVHRPRADWHVAVGPFDVAVTGTSFDIETVDPREGFEIAMKVGAVVVRGPLTGGGIALRAGQRLVASLSRRTLVIGDLAPPSAPPAPAAPSAAGDDRGGAGPTPPRSRRQRSVAANERVRGAGRPAALTPEASVGASAVLPRQTVPAPPPSAAPPPPRSALLDAGGPACATGGVVQLTFDAAGETALAGHNSAVALSGPRPDHSRSWCGAGSLRFAANFSAREIVNARLEGSRPSQAGEAIIRLPTLIDLRGKTVVLHLFVEGPADASFDVRVFGESVGTRMGHDVTRGLHPGRWLTVRSYYPPGIPTYDPQQSTEPTGVQNLIVRLDATGPVRAWTGALYLDDVSWH
jgi:hypothetical protein